MPKRFPEWVNTQVVIKAIKMREEGMLSKQLNLWIQDLLEMVPNARTMPQIWLDEEHIGGFYELEKKLK